MNPGQKSQVEVGNWTTKLWMMRRDVLGVLHLDNHLFGVSVRPEIGDEMMRCLFSLPRAVVGVTLCHFDLSHQPGFCNVLAMGSLMAEIVQCPHTT